ncbi:MAG: hypothetical protein EXR75_10305 [Myxococcales bacterium]|nr:hypothetical protein [Myxococcales bacterium]
MSLVGSCRGGFEETPFSHLLVRLFDERWTGTLTLRPPDAEPQVVSLERGLPTRVGVADGYGRLGEILANAAAAPELTPAREVADTGEERGPVSDRAAQPTSVNSAQVERALVTQLLMRLERIFSLPRETAWELSADGDSPAGIPSGVRVDVPRVLWRGIAAHGESDVHIDAVLARLGVGPVTLAGDGRIERFGFDGAALALVERIRADSPPLAVLMFAADEARTRRIVYVLALTRYLQPAKSSSKAEAQNEPVEETFLDAQTPVSIPPSAPTPADAITSSEAPSFSLEALSLDEPANGTPSVPQAAADSDREPSAQPPPVAKAAAEPSEKLAPVSKTAAQIGRVILKRVPRSRAWSEGMRTDGGRAGAPSSSRRTSPDDLHEQALYELLSGRFSEALNFCDRAFAGRSDDLEIQATRAWIRAHQQRPDLKVLTLDLDDVLLQDPEQIDARFYRGVLRRRLGNDAGARSDLERVLALDPEHRAARAQLDRC